ncbi:murein hydrolase activator EnvC [Sporosarcina sp. resist]|uniref:murein hydrolase activator EnvC family protein n=1 Tax=Sporosarcina sp. resist TaxID=2762563 RepID=UPI00210588DC|nr:M23 family metallopeptidase [Sporosarcina sp. resist]
MNRYKKLLSGTIAIVFLSTIISGAGVLASPLDDLKKEQKLLDKKKSELNTGISKKNTEIKSKKTTIEKITDQILALNAKINESNEQINRVIGQINKTTEEIDALRISIADLEKKIEERDVVLRERVRAMQVKGGQVSYLDVLLGANSFADFIDRFSAVNSLMDADRSIMEQQASDIAQLEEEKALVESKLAKQEAAKKELQNLRASLLAQKSDKNKLIDKLEAEQQKLANEKEKLEVDFHETYEVSKDVEKKIITEQKRIAEIARQAEIARKAAAAQAAKDRQNSSGSGGSSTYLPPVSNGTWTKPASGTYTSSFGWRTHPIYGTQRQHRGADIANSTGTSVVSAGDGVVSHAGPMGTYGNVIMVTHSIDGQIFTTVYAHLSSINTSAGQQVAKGQFIGKIGTTGASTGPHLHFEMHIGNWSASGPSAVNPLRYVSF